VAPLSIVNGTLVGEPLLKTSGICTADIDFFRCVILWYSNDRLWQHVRQS